MRKPPQDERTVREAVERLLTAVAAGVALLGGLVLVAMAAVTVYGIIGRALPNDLPLLGWWRSVRGNFELVQLATAFAIFSFLPYAQMRRGNVLVDFFTSRASPRAKAWYAVLANGIYSVLAILFAWRMIVGTHDIMTARFVQTTLLLRLPIWYGHLPATIFMTFLAVVCLFTLWRSLDEALGTGEPQ